MDEADDIFAQIDRLDHGSYMLNERSSSARQPYGIDEDYDPTQLPFSPWSQQDAIPSEPMQHDSFVEYILRMPDPDSRQSQAQMGRARLSLPSQATRNSRMAVNNACNNRSTGGLDVSHHPYDYLDSQAIEPSSSVGLVLHSSPALSASQRRPPHNVPRHFPASRQAPSDIGTNSRTPARSHGNPNTRTPVIQSIELVPTSLLPDRCRALFHFPLFNVIQSKSFDHVYHDNDNFVLSSPTGSGKTAIFELAICRLVHGRSTGSYKVVYMAPTKSLCSERSRDWKKRFSPLNLTVEEMTGDSDSVTLRAVQTADVIVTTPEKWDSMTRKWKDHEKLVQLIKLILIDEVHILTNNRGATLEAVVSRMKSVGSEIRFIALSATVPNSQDIAAWLGKNSANQHLPATREVFGEKFRPVPLQKHVCGYESKGNDYAFDSFLTKKLPEVVGRYSSGKPIMIFCLTRNSCKITADALATWWSSLRPQDRPWKAPTRPLRSQDKSLQDLMTCGIAVHHAGISPEDRSLIEHSFLNNELFVICCTSTLAVGVNLPCHTVIIKGTVAFEDGLRVPKELSDLDILQMIGRAGRPQFDSSATAVIMTRSHKVEAYNKMVSGQQVLESRLHLNLLEHFNSEVGLGTITDLASAKTWLSGTFMFVRLKANPVHYQLDSDTRNDSLDDRLERICLQAIELLANHDLVEDGATVRSTAFGEAMARYYVSFETMKVLMSLPPSAKISEILSSLCQAQEFHEIKFRQNEKPAYKEVNKSPCIRFPIKVDLAMPAQKVSLIMQATLGGVDTLSQSKEHRLQYSIDQSIIFQHARRIIRCIVDCQSHVGDSIAIRNALSLVRSFGARVWDDSPLYLQQLSGIGPVIVRRLINANIRTVEDLETTEPGRIERILSKNPPYGLNLLKQLREFPRLAVSLKAIGEPVARGEFVVVKVKAELSFLNDRPPVYFQKKPVYVSVLAETSDGRKAHFGRISGQKLGTSLSFAFDAPMNRANQSVVCYVACDKIAGTLQQASIKPDIDSSLFPSISSESGKPFVKSKTTHAARPNSSKARVPPTTTSRAVYNNEEDDFGDDGLDDNDLVNAGSNNTGFQDIDDIDLSTQDEPVKSTTNTQSKGSFKQQPSRDRTSQDPEPRRLPNGNWECGHKCKDREKCKHPCCKEGTETKPKPKKPKQKENTQLPNSHQKEKTQSKLQLSKPSLTALAHRPKAGVVDGSNASEQSLNRTPNVSQCSKMPQHVETVNKLHHSTQKATSFRPIQRAESDYTYRKGMQPTLSFLEDAPDQEAERTLDFDDDDVPIADLVDSDLEITDLNDVSATGDFEMQPTQLHAEENDEYDAQLEDDNLIEDALIGAEDPYHLLSTYTASSQDAMVFDFKKNRSEASAITLETTVLTRTVDLPCEVPNKDSLFVQDNSSTPVRRIVDDSTALPAKRALDAVLEPNPDGIQEMSNASKKARTIADDGPEDSNAWYESQHNNSHDEASQKVVEAAGISKEQELRQWLLEEFGDLVELI